MACITEFAKRIPSRYSPPEWTPAAKHAECQYTTRIFSAEASAALIMLSGEMRNSKGHGCCDIYKARQVAGWHRKGHPRSMQRQRYHQSCSVIPAQVLRCWQWGKRAKNGFSEADRLGIVGLELSWTPAPVPAGRPAVLLHWERTNSSRGLLAAYDLSLYFLEPLILIHNHPPFRAPRPRFSDQCYDLLLITRAKVTALSHLRTTKPPVCNHPSPIA